jgi:hypothetical protein
VGLLVLIGGVVAMIMCGHLLAGLRTRIALRGTKIRLVVPTWRGVYPFPPFRTVQLDARQLSAVEVRDEASRGLGLTMIARVVSVVTGTGERIVIALEAPGELGGLRADEIAQSIASSRTTASHEPRSGRRGLAFRGPDRPIRALECRPARRIPGHSDEPPGHSNMADHRAVADRVGPDTGVPVAFELGLAGRAAAQAPRLAAAPPSSMGGGR